MHKNLKTTACCMNMMPCELDATLAYILYGWMTFLNTCSEITLFSWIPIFVDSEFPK